MNIEEFLAYHKAKNLEYRKIIELGSNFVHKTKYYLLFKVAKYFTSLMYKNYITYDNVIVCGGSWEKHSKYGDCECIRIYENTLMEYRKNTFKGKIWKIIDSCARYFKTYFEYKLYCFRKENELGIIIIESLVKNNKSIKEIELTIPYYFNLDLFYTDDEIKVTNELNRFYSMLESSYQKTCFWGNDNEIKSAYGNNLSK